jgi:ribosome-binding factor A
VTQRRPERVAHLVQAELARLLLHEAKDARLHDVTITAVRVTPDLRHARVYFRTLADTARADEIARALERAAPFLRTRIARALAMKVTPDLRFEYDTVPDTGRRIDALLGSGRPKGPDDEDEP